MKKLCFLVFLLLVSVRTFSQWTLQNPLPTGNHLNSVYFVDFNTGYAVGGNWGNEGTIIKTTNAGSTWTVLSSGNNNTLCSVHFTDFNTGYAVGDNGTILKTTDAGNTWISSVSGAENSRLHSICFPNADLGYAVGGTYWIGGIILKTTNAGSTWTTLVSGTSAWLNSVYFTDANTGYVVGNGGTILKTINGGNTWIALPSGSTQNLYSIYFTDFNTCFVVGAKGTILKTINAGATWTALSSGFSAWLNSVFFTEPNTGYAVGDTLIGGNGTGSVLKTIDAGATWITQSSGTTNSLKSIFFTDTSAGYIVGMEGAILKTTNGGGLSIRESKLPESKFNIYPNPANGKITISSNDNLTNDADVSIQNISGTEVLHENYQYQERFEIDVRILPPGIYLLKIKTNVGIDVEKLVIQ